MKKPLSELRTARDDLAAEAKKINDAYPANSRMPQAISDQLDGILNKIDATDREIGANHEANQAAGADRWRVDGGDVKVLRTSADIRKHYAGMKNAAGAFGGPNDNELQLDDFMRGVAGMKTTSAVQASLSVGTDTAGGYAVPLILMPNILDAMVPASSLLQAGAGIVPLDIGGKNFTTAAVSSIPTAAWRVENGPVAESDPTFRAVVATPRSLAFYFKVSRELLADAQNMTAAFTTAIAQAFAKEIDRAGLRGSGTAPEPRGVLNTPGIQTVTNGTNGASLASYANFLSAHQALLQVDSPMPTAAIMSPRSQITLAGLKDTTNQPLMMPQMLQPMRMITSSQIPNNLTVGTSTDCSEIYVGDFTKMVFMMREQMTIMSLGEQFATNGQVGFVCHMRADVAVMYPAALSVITGVRP